MAIQIIQINRFILMAMTSQAAVNALALDYSAEVQDHLMLR